MLGDRVKGIRGLEVMQVNWQGTEQGRIMSMISNLNLEDRIEVEFSMEKEMLWGKQENADLLCHACGYEGLGKTIIESIALGLPVLVSNIAPLNEYMRTAKAGF